MPRVALWFFAVAPIYLVSGISLGMYMGGSGDHSLAPAHAHLNLLGWVTMGLYGSFFAFAREQASTRLAWATFAFANTGILLMFPMLVLVLKFGEQPQYILPLVISEFLVLFGVLCFAVSVWKVLLKPTNARTPHGLATPSAAE